MEGDYTHNGIVSVMAMLRQQRIPLLIEKLPASTWDAYFAMSHAVQVPGGLDSTGIHKMLDA